MFSMWIRRSPAEVASAKRARFLRTACLDCLLGAAVWFIFVRLFMIFGVLPRDVVSGCVGGAVIAVILPAVWYDNWRTQRKSKGTLVCDRCNLVKAADGQLNCQCGGLYHSLDEMKWTDLATTNPARKSA
jgi:hypothetical protein